MKSMVNGDASTTRDDMAELEEEMKKLDQQQDSFEDRVRQFATTNGNIENYNAAIKSFDNRTKTSFIEKFGKKFQPPSSFDFLKSKKPKKPSVMKKKPTFDLFKNRGIYFSSGSRIERIRALLEEDTTLSEAEKREFSGGSSLGLFFLFFVITTVYVFFSPS